MNIKLNSEASEKLFAELCARSYLRGFVFHSPKYKYSGGEEEVGDVVLWVRDILIVFEIIWKSPDLFSSPKSFVKRIGEKRDQLIKDYRYYGEASKQIKMKNEAHEEIYFDHQNFNEIAFCGIVIVDTDVSINKLHFETVRKSLEQDFSIAFMTRQDFAELLVEVDTPADLFYYLNDRRKFLTEVFREEASLFLDLNLRYERNLIGFYKLNNNSFPVEAWKSSLDKNFWHKYKLEFTTQIELRDRENVDSFIFDEIIDLLRNNNQPHDSTLLHSWELAVLPRRFRAGLAKKLNSAFEGMVSQRSRRHFAFYNPSTECWSLFYFQYGGDSKSFVEEAERLAKMKMQVERIQQNFQYSVFCFAFRKSSIDTGNTFDECVLRIEDADNHSTVSPEDYQLALKYFRGSTKGQKIYEFPA
jgi:hypothetical protein